MQQPPQAHWQLINDAYQHQLQKLRVTNHDLGSGFSHPIGLALAVLTTWADSASTRLTSASPDTDGRAGTGFHLLRQQWLHRTQGAVTQRVGMVAALRITLIRLVRAFLLNHEPQILIRSRQRGFTFSRRLPLALQINQFIA